MGRGDGMEEAQLEMSLMVSVIILAKRKKATNIAVHNIIWLCRCSLRLRDTVS